MASGLDSLAVEIIELVASSLDFTDLSSLRCVCKDLNQKLLYYFSRTYFATVRTDLSRRSLEKLQKISKAEPFGCDVLVLHVDLISNRREQGYEDFKGKASCPRHPSGYLEASLPGAQMLRDFLIGGPASCRSFSICGYDDSGYPQEPGYLTPSDAVWVLSSITAETNLPIRSLTVRFNDHGTGRLDTKRLQMSLYQQQEFRCGWAHLQELYLDYSIDFDDCDWAMNLILYAPKLQKLSLDFYDGDVPLIDRLISQQDLPELQHLSLSRAYITVDKLSRLLVNCHNSLRELSFRWVRMARGSTWVQLFRDLKGKFPCLESISVFGISEEMSGETVRITFSKLSENPVVPGSKKATPARSDRRLFQPSGLPVRLSYRQVRPGMMWFGVSYHGPEMDTLLEILAESAERFDWKRGPDP